MQYLELQEAIKRCRAKIAVVGLGHVGLPTSALFAKAGFFVVGIDVKKELVKQVNLGNCPLPEPGLPELVKTLAKSGQLRAEMDTALAVKSANVVIIVVNTPANGSVGADLTSFKEACEAVGKGLQRGTLVIVISTVPPKTTEELVVPILEKQSKLKVGYDFWVAYSPEQATPTKILDEMQSQNRIVAGINSESTDLAEALFRKIVNGKIVKINQPAVAELAKILQNIYRDVNIALANEVALICDKLGIDTHEAIELANLHPRVHFHKPGAGVGGPCLPKDPLFLIENAKEVGFEPRLIELARQINNEMPSQVIRLTLEAFSQAKKSIAEAKIAVLGVTYKGNVNNVVASPAKPIIQELLKLGTKVFVHDPYCKETFGGKRVETIEDALIDADGAIIVTDHSVYEQLDIDYLTGFMKNYTIIIDARGILKAISKPNLILKRI